MCIRDSLSPDQIEKLKADMARCSWLRKPFDLTNTSAETRRVKERIEDLSKRAETEFSGWEFEGGHVETVSYTHLRNRARSNPML